MSASPSTGARRRLPKLGILLGFALAGIGGAFLLMAYEGHTPLGIVLGGALIAVATAALSGLVCGREDGTKELEQRIGQGKLVVWLSAVLLSLVLFGLALGAAVRGTFGLWTSGAVVLATYAILLSAIGGAAGLLEDPAGRGRGGGGLGILRRPGFWLMLVCGAMALPALGHGSLWDPWETHYGEVAREMLSRDDWVSPWWATQGWFFSKPVLALWMQALALGGLGAAWEPGQMIAGAGGTIAHPEWAVRAPGLLLSLAAVYIVYRAIGSLYNRRAGILSALILATCPFWFLVSHQSITDMPYVASATASLCLFAAALHTPQEQRLVSRRVVAGRWSFSLSYGHAVVALILVVVLPQVLYLITRNVGLVWSSGVHGFRWHLDEVLSGSPGNCGLPGNPACAWMRPRGHLEPIAQAALWTGVLAVVLARVRKATTTKAILYLAGWCCAGIAVMAKGPAGVVLPGFALCAAVVSTRRWHELRRLQILEGGLILSAFVLPWAVALVVRHGSAFTDELLFHDMIDRAISHVHDTNDQEETSLRYYLCQLAIGLFPWTGLGPWGLAWALRRRRDATAALLSLGFLGTFTLFSVMGTRFHHYILPAVPPLAVMLGVYLENQFLGYSKVEGGWGPRAAALCSALITVIVALELLQQSPSTKQPGALRLLQMFTYRYDRTWSGLDFRVAIGAVAALALLLSVAQLWDRLRQAATAALVVVALGWAVWGQDVYLVRASPHWGQREVIAAYYQLRRGKEEPLAAYRLNWKGENFYTGNQLSAFLNAGALASWVEQQRQQGTRRVYVVTERSQVSGLTSALSGKTVTPVTDQRHSNQFLLLRAEL